MRRKGSISIETAISFSIVLVFMACMVTVVSLHRTNIIMQASVEASCEKIAVLAPLSVPAADSIYTIVNALPDSDVLSSQTANVISSIGSSFLGIDMYTGNSLSELILDETLGQVLRDDIAYEYNSRSNSSLLVPESIAVSFYINDSQHILEVEVQYSTNSILGTRTRKVYSIVPLYGDFELLLNPEQSVEDESSIWNEHNFVRGRYFRERYGANLPQTFPVIDTFNNGNAESIVSIDLTAPTYNSGDSAAYQRLCEEIDELAGFDGVDIVVSGDRYIISEDEIVSKTLNVIVPSNSPPDALNDVYSAVSYGNSSGVNVIVIEDGESTRFS